MKKSINTLTLLSVSITLLAGCSTNAGWVYSKEDAANFLELTATTIENEDNTYKFVISSSKQVFKKELSSKDVILFDKTAIDQSVAEHKQSYYTYDLVKKYKVEFTNFDNPGNGTNISFDFINNKYSDYAALINKKAISEDNYAFAMLANLGSSSDDSKIQTEFEESYISATPSWNDAKTVINLIGGISTFITGVASGGAPVIVAGIFSMITNFGDIFGNTGNPSIADVLNRLDQIDAKLDRIEEEIATNQRQLLDETVKTQAMINEALMGIYDQNIEYFNTEYIVNMDKQLARYQTYLEFTFKNYASEQRNIDLYYEIGEDETTLHFESEGSVESYSKYSYSLNFPNSMKYLKDNRNIVGDGFFDAFRSDIKESIKVSRLPYRVKQDQLVEDIYATIVDNFQVERYTKADQDMINQIVDYKTLVLNACKRFTGGPSKSVIDSYVGRLQLMYNFAGEAKDTLRGILVALRFQIDRYMIQALTACQYAGINAKDLSEAYLEAIEAVQYYYNENKDLSDTYCFQTQKVMEVNLYRTQWNVGYTDIGNYPTFSSALRTDLVYHYDGNTIGSVEVRLDQLNIATEADHLRIRTRYGLLKSQGLTKAENYFEYLKSVSLFVRDGGKTYESLREVGYIGDDAMKFLTSFTIRDLSGNDKNLSLECVAYGNKRGDYFNIGWKGKYKSAHNESCWSGKMAEGVFIDAETGTVNTNRNIASYATYSESHAYWVNDEYWAFKDNPYGNYYFMLTNMIVF